MSFGDTDISFSNIAQIIDGRTPGPGTTISLSSFRGKMGIPSSGPISIKTYFKGKTYVQPITFFTTSVSLDSIYNNYSTTNTNNYTIKPGDNDNYNANDKNNIILKNSGSGWYFYIQVNDLVKGDKYIIQFDYYTSYTDGDVEFEWNSDSAWESTTYWLLANNTIQTAQLQFTATDTYLNFHVGKKNSNNYVYIKNFSIIRHYPNYTLFHYSNNKENKGDMNYTQYDGNDMNNIILKNYSSSSWYFYIKVNNLVVGDNYYIQFDYYTSYTGGDVEFKWNSNAGYETDTFTLTAKNTIQTYQMGFNALSYDYFNFYIYKANNYNVYIKNFSVKKRIGDNKRAFKIIPYSSLSKSRWIAVENGGDNASCDENTYLLPINTTQHDPRITWEDGKFKNIISDTTIFFQRKINPAIDYIGIELTLNGNVDGWIALTDIDKSWPDYPQWNSSTKTYDKVYDKNDDKNSYNVGVYNGNISVANKTNPNTTPVGNTNRTTLQEGDSIRLVVHNEEDMDSYICVYSKAVNTNIWVKNHQFQNTGKPYNYDWAISYTTSNTSANKDDIRLVSDANNISGEWVYFNFDTSVHLSKIITRSQTNYEGRNARVISLVASNDSSHTKNNKIIASNVIGHPTTEPNATYTKSYDYTERGKYMVFDFEGYIRNDDTYQYWGIVIQGLVGSHLGDPDGSARVINLEYIYFFDKDGNSLNSNITIGKVSSQYSDSWGAATLLIDNTSAWEQSSDYRIYNDTTGYIQYNPSETLTIHTA